MSEKGYLYHMSVTVRTGGIMNKSPFKAVECNSHSIRKEGAKIIEVDGQRLEHDRLDKIRPYYGSTSECIGFHIWTKDLTLRDQYIKIMEGMIAETIKTQQENLNQLLTALKGIESEA